MEIGISPVLKTENFTEDELKIMACCSSIGYYTFTKNGAKMGPANFSCHGSMSYGEITKYTNVITAFNGNAEGTDAILKFLFWNKGPFRDLVSVAPDKWTFLMKDGKVLGIGIPDEVMAFKPWSLVYAFLICTRLGQEHKHVPKSFAKLVELGHEPALSYIASVFLNWDGNSFVTGAGSSWSGGHQIFNDTCISYGTESQTRCIDYKSFRDSTYHKDLGNVGLYCSRIWSFKNKDEVRKSTNKFMWDAYSTEIKTRFTSTRGISVEHIGKAMEDFYKFLMLRYPADEKDEGCQYYRKIDEVKKPKRIAKTKAATAKVKENWVAKKEPLRKVKVA